MNERLALLIAYLDADLEAAERLVSRLAEDRDLPPEVEASWRGYALHNLYSALERLFERIARTFENQVEEPAHYHAELLRRMTLTVPQVRPAVLSREAYEVLSELRGFRHVFRHAYDYALDADRVRRFACAPVGRVSTARSAASESRSFAAPGKKRTISRRQHPEESFSSARVSGTTKVVGSP